MMGTRHSAKWHAEQLAAVAAQRDDYTVLRRHVGLAAVERGPSDALTYEADRLDRLIAEWDAEYDARIEDAIRDGWTPDDIEAAS